MICKTVVGHCRDDVYFLFTLAISCSIFHPWHTLTGNSCLSVCQKCNNAKQAGNHYCINYYHLFLSEFEEFDFIPLFSSIHFKLKYTATTARFFVHYHYLHIMAERRDRPQLAFFKIMVFCHECRFKAVNHMKKMCMII